ncbi:hypothetical protein JST97_09755 [bacterium]|nr:hypothetical protein [bacterium]
MVYALRFAFITGTMSAALLASPLRFRLDQPFQRQVQLDPRNRVELRFQGREVLEVTIAGRKQSLPLESVASETNPQARGEVLVEDFDFDGCKDIAVPTGIGYGGVNVFYQVYRLRRQTLEPVPGDWAVCNPEFSPKDRTLLTNSRSGPFWYGTDYRVHQGKPWVWRRRLPVTLDELAPDTELLCLFEVYDREGRVQSARMSGDPSRMTPVQLKLGRPVVIYPQPGSRGTLGSLKAGTSAALGEVRNEGGHCYVKVEGQGWFRLPEGSIHR